MESVSYPSNTDVVPLSANHSYSGRKWASRSPRHDACPAAPLLFEGRLEAFAVNRQAFLLGEFLEELDRDPVGLVEVEDRLPRHGVAAGAFHAFELPLRDIGSAVQGAGEALLFLAQLGCDNVAAFTELRKNIAHLVDHDRQQGVEKSAVEPEFASVSECAADDPAKDIAAAFIGGHDPVGHQKGRGPEVVGDHPEGGREVV